VRGQTFRPCGADEVLTEHREHLDPDDAGEHGDRSDRKYCRSDSSSLGT
jgi:hypothetical protein